MHILLCSFLCNVCSFSTLHKLWLYSSPIGIFLSSFVSCNLFIATAFICISSNTASNWVLKKIKPNRWLPFIGTDKRYSAKVILSSSHLVGAWGITTTFSGFTQSYGGLIAVRLVLGLCEGGLLPGMVWFSRFCICSAYEHPTRCCTWVLSTSAMNFNCGNVFIISYW